MDKIIWVIVAVVVIAAAGYWAVNQNSRNNEGSTQVASDQKTGSPDMVKTEKIEGQQSINDLLGMNKNMRCTYSGAQDKTSYSGEAFIAGPRMASRVEVKTEGQPDQVIRMIKTDENFYTWTDEKNEGMTAKIKDMLDLANKFSGSAGVDTNQKYNVSCDNWNVDASKFIVPANIQFSDITSTLNKAGEALQNLPSANDALCNAMPEGLAKQACLQTIGQ